MMAFRVLTSSPKSASGARSKKANDHRPDVVSIRRRTLTNSGRELVAMRQLVPRDADESVPYVVEFRPPELREHFPDTVGGARRRAIAPAHRHRERRAGHEASMVVPSEKMQVTLRIRAGMIFGQHRCASRFGARRRTSRSSWTPARTPRASSPTFSPRPFGPIAEVESMPVHVE